MGHRPASRGTLSSWRPFRSTLWVEVTGMKYVLLFCGSDEDAAAFAAMTPDELRALQVIGGADLRPVLGEPCTYLFIPGPQTATSVRFGLDGPPVVTDGPYLE